MDQPLKAVLFDFDGVLCRGRFYEPRLSLEYPDAKAWLQKNFFVSGNEMIRRWMRGQLSSQDVHAHLEKEIGIAAQELETLMTESLRMFVLDAALLEWVSRLRTAGIRTAVVTDNMDVFTRLAVQMHGLDRRFDAVVNSADHGCLKNDEQSLFEVALGLLGVNAHETLHIDDTERTVERFRNLGGQAYLFTTESASGLDGILSGVVASATHEQNLLRVHHDGIQGYALRRNDE